jgi:hypothetical protein
MSDCKNNVFSRFATIPAAICSRCIVPNVVTIFFTLQSLAFCNMVADTSHDMDTFWEDSFDACAENADTQAIAACVAA